MHLQYIETMNMGGMDRVLGQWVTSEVMIRHESGFS